MMLSFSEFTNSRGKRFVIAAFAFLLLPLGVMQAQDFEAVRKRLAKAVKHDEISFEHAAVMMHALEEFIEDEHGHHEHGDHDHGGHDHEHDDGYRAELDHRRQELHQLELEVFAAVDAGKLSKEDAREKIEWAKRKWLNDDDHDHGDHDHDEEHNHNHNDHDDDVQVEEVDERLQIYRKAETELKKFVESGRATEEQAKQRLGRLRLRLWNSEKENDREDEDEFEDEGDIENEDDKRAKRRARERYRAAEQEIDRLLKAGKISKERAEASLKKLKRDLFESRSTQIESENERADDAQLNELKEFRSRLTKRLESGEITIEEGREALMQQLQKMDQYAAERIKAREAQDAQFRKLREAERREQQVLDEKERRSASENRRLKYEAARQKSDREQKGRALKERLAKAVESGRMTGQEARTAYRRLMGESNNESKEQREHLHNH